MLDILSYKNIFIWTDTSIFILFVIAWSHTIGKMALSGLNAQNIWSISYWNNSSLCWTPSASRFFFNLCVSANTHALHFHKSGITLTLRLNTIHVKSVSFHIMTELQLYWCNTHKIGMFYVTRLVRNICSRSFDFYAAIIHLVP